MPKSKGLLNKNFRGLLWVAITAFAIYLIVRNISVFGNVLLVLIGFGAVVIFHEFGHFVVAKLSDIKVEAFSIFMPPTLLGVRKVKDGFRFRILPKLFPPSAGRDDESGKSRGTRDERRETRDERRETRDEQRETRVGETEYRIGLIPFGGFVKMLGQDDTGPVKASDDPRSFANKPVSTRVLVIAAGVIFNVISAVIIFMIVFLIGINLPPAVVGEVVPNSPAAQAGLRPGDEIIQIAGKSKDLDFSSIMIAAALSNKGEKVPLTVRHKDGSEEEIELEAKHLPGEPMRVFGIEPPLDLTVAEVSDTNTLLENTGLLAGDRIRRVDGREVRNYWELVEIVQNTFTPTVAVEVERASELRKCELRLDLSPAESYEVTSESDLRHIYSMVPRLRITSILEVPERTSKFEIPNLKSGDIIVSINDVEYPTYKEMREVTKEHEGKELKVAVIRADANGVEETWALTVVPKRPPGGDRVLIGVGVALDAEHPVVAKTIATDDGPAKFQIPRGARIKAINGVAVSSFYDIIKEIRQYAGQRIKIDYLDGQMPGSVTLDVSGSKEIVTVKSTFAQYIPFKPLEIPYRASGPIHAITMGYGRTVMFIAQTYVTLKRLIGGAVSPKHLMGPVGIMAFSYRIVAEQPLVDYAYLLGLISAVIAVFNLLPLPPLDGGLIILLLVEKIKGSALSERTCGIVAYAGWVLIGSLLLYLTFNDVVRNFFS